MKNDMRKLFNNNPSFAQAFTSDGLVQISVSGQKTAKYNIVSGGYTGQEDDNSGSKHVYEVSIDEPLKEGETMLANLSLASSSSNNGTSLSIILFEEKFERKPEFYGRFFVRINRNSVFDTNIIQSFPALDTEYNILYSRDVDQDITNDFSRTISDDGVTKKKARSDLAWTDTKAKDDFTQVANIHPVLGKNTFTVYWAGVNYGEDWQDNVTSDKGKKHNELDTVNQFLENL